MGKLEELTEDQLNALPDDVKEAVTGGITELWKARWVIWNLNKQIKDWTGNDEWDNKNFSKEDMENYLKEQKRWDELDNFIKWNPAFEDKKDKISDLMWKGLSLEESKWAVLSGDETFKNNLNTNQEWISWWNPTWNQSFNNKQSFEDYKGMSKEEQGAYKDACVKSYWWLTFSDTHEADD